MSDEYLTIDEIEQCYPNEWVVIDRPKTARYQGVLGGFVVFHTPDRDELDRHLTELDLSDHVAIRHTSNLTRTVGPVWGRWSGVISIGKALVALGLLIGVGWAGHVITMRTHVPEGVRIFDRVGDQLEAHYQGVCQGRVTKLPPNGIGPTSYPVPDELRRAGIGYCQEREGALWYGLPSHPLDGGSPYLVKPIQGQGPESVSGLPRQSRYKTYRFLTLKDNWAYWFVLP